MVDDFALVGNKAIFSDAEEVDLGTLFVEVITSIDASSKNVSLSHIAIDNNSQMEIFTIKGQRIYTGKFFNNCAPFLRKRGVSQPVYIRYMNGGILIDSRIILSK